MFHEELWRFPEEESERDTHTSGEKGQKCERRRKPEKPNEFIIYDSKSTREKET